MVSEFEIELLRSMAQDHGKALERVTAALENDVDQISPEGIELLGEAVEGMTAFNAKVEEHLADAPQTKDRRMAEVEVTTRDED